MSSICVTYCNLLPIKRGKVVLYYSGEKYAGGCRYLVEEFLRRNATRELVCLSGARKVETPTEENWDRPAESQIDYLVSNSEQIDHFDEKTYKERSVVCLKKMGCVESGHTTTCVVDLIEN